MNLESKRPAIDLRTILETSNQSIYRNPANVHISEFMKKLSPPRVITKVILNFLLCPAKLFAATCLFSLLAIGQAAVDENEAIKVSTGIVTSNVVVNNLDGSAITGLLKADFSVFIDGYEKQIDFFGSDSLPASISIVFDTSGSMTEEKIDKAKTALAHFIETTSDKDEFFLINFSDKPILKLARGINCVDALKLLTNVNPQGNTALYDAVAAGLDNVEKGRFSKKIVLIISDGEDNNSRLSQRYLFNKMKETGATVLAVGFKSKNPITRTKTTGNEILEEITKVTGGAAYIPHCTDELDENFEKVSLAIRNIYSVGFYENEPVRNSKKKMQVKVKLPTQYKKASIRARRFYTIPVE